MKSKNRKNITSWCRSLPPSNFRSHSWSLPLCWFLGGVKSWKNITSRSHSRGRPPSNTRSRSWPQCCRFGRHKSQLWLRLLKLLEWPTPTPACYIFPTLNPPKNHWLPARISRHKSQLRLLKFRSDRLQLQLVIFFQIWLWLRLHRKITDYNSETLSYVDWLCNSVVYGKEN